MPALGEDFLCAKKTKIVTLFNYFSFPCQSLMHIHNSMTMHVTRLVLKIITFGVNNTLTKETFLHRKVNENGWIDR